jgi:immune inhibitor A
MGKSIGGPGYEGTLAHEFQHMIHANIDANESLWLNEGLAELAAALVGYREHSGYADAFMANPGVQLNTWSAAGSSAAHYGAAYLFVSYFLGRFGDDALRALVADPANDLASVTHTLSRLNIINPATGAPYTAEDVFVDWTVATLLNQTAKAPDAPPIDSHYRYQNFPTQLPSLKLSGDAVVGQDTPLEVTQFGATYLNIPVPGNYTLTFGGDPTVRVIPTEAHSGTHLWWSNRGENLNTRLTRAFDLRSVTNATLTFWTWYAIETGWDFGYVEVSVDGGATWQPLAVLDSAPTSANNPYGPAFTGLSGGGDTTPVWQQQRANLSLYAGREILIRFEYLTDGGVSQQGMALDDITIPEIGYSTDAEAGADGWQAEGWVQIENILPARYSVQIVNVSPDAAPSVTSYLIEGSHLSEEFTVTGSAVLVISGLTE